MKLPKPSFPVFLFFVLQLIGDYTTNTYVYLQSRTHTKTQTHKHKHAHAHTHTQTHGKGQHKLLIIGTTGLSDEVLERTGIRGAFNSCIEVPYLTSPRELMTVIRGDTDEKVRSPDHGGGGRGLMTVIRGDTNEKVRSPDHGVGGTI